MGRAGELPQFVERPQLPGLLQDQAVFSALVASLGISLSLVLAVFADRVVRGSGIYKTLLIWPYAVAPAVAGVLWLFMFSPSIGIVAFWLGYLGVDWNHLINGNHAMTLVVIPAQRAATAKTAATVLPEFNFVDIGLL